MVLYLHLLQITLQNQKLKLKTLKLQRQKIKLHVYVAPSDSTQAMQYTLPESSTDYCFKPIQGNQTKVLVINDNKTIRVLTKLHHKRSGVMNMSGTPTHAKLHYAVATD